MKTILRLLFAAAAFCSWSNAFTLPGTQEQYAPRCVHEILNCRYTAALSIADSAAGADSLDPLAPLLRLAAIGIRDVDFDTLSDTAAFFAACRAAGSRIDEWESARGVSSYSAMLRGFCKGIFATFNLRRGSYYTAASGGFSALSTLGKAYRLDTSNAEPLFLLGLYDYAKGELKKRLGGVLFWFPGSKAEGVGFLLRCSGRGLLTGTGARFALAEIYTREKELDRCAELLDSLKTGFPDSRFTLWAQAKFLESKRLFYEASLVCERLFESYAAEPAGAYNAFYARNLQAHYLVQSGQRKYAAAVCRELLQRTRDRRNGSLYRDTKKMLKKINDGDY